MTPYTKSWNETVVRNVFSANLASKILNTPLINQVESDRLLWKVEKNGRYSVRSAYRLFIEDLIDSSHLHSRVSVWNMKSQGSSLMVEFNQIY